MACCYATLARWESLERSASFPVTSAARPTPCRSKSRHSTMTTTLSPPLPLLRSSHSSQSLLLRSSPRSNGGIETSSLPLADMSIMVEHISKSYSAYPALENVSLTIHNREFVALLG